MNSPVARWRWLVALVLCLSYILVPTLLNNLQSPGEGAAKLPANSFQLVFFGAIQMAIFGVFWLLFWLFSRANREQLFWQNPRPWAAFGWGLAYSIGLRLLLAAIVVALATFFVIVAGVKPDQFSDFVVKNRFPTEKLVAPKALQDPIYVGLMTTYIAFVIAALREELWRAATLAALLQLFPASWHPNRKWAGAILVSSLVFGLGHWYQGWIGVCATTILGAGLGWSFWRHKSLWPAFWAHGLIDATTFLALAAMGGQIPLQ